MRLIVLVLSALFVSGCASSSVNKQNLNELDRRLDHFEQRLGDQSERIGDVKSDLTDISLRMSEKRAYKDVDVSFDAASVLSVTQTQKALSNAGYYKGKIDGVAGTATDKAIRSFQAKMGLKVDGKVGKETSRYLRKYLK